MFFFAFSWRHATVCGMKCGESAALKASAFFLPGPAAACLSALCLSAICLSAACLSAAAGSFAQAPPPSSGAKAAACQDAVLFKKQPFKDRQIRQFAETLTRAYSLSHKRGPEREAFQSRLSGFLEKGMAEKAALGRLMSEGFFSAETPGQSPGPLIGAMLSQPPETAAALVDNSPGRLQEGALLGSPPFFIAVLLNERQIAEAFLRADKELARLKNPRGESPLHYASSPEMAELLLARGADPNSRDKKGYAPLHYVRDPETAKALLRGGADPHIKDRSGRAPLKHHEEPAGEPQIARLLQEALREKSERPPARAAKKAAGRAREQTSASQLENRRAEAAAAAARRESFRQERARQKQRRKAQKAAERAAEREKKSQEAENAQKERERRIAEIEWRLRRLDREEQSLVMQLSQGIGAAPWPIRLLHAALFSSSEKFPRVWEKAGAVLIEPRLKNIREETLRLQEELKNLKAAAKKLSPKKASP